MSEKQTFREMAKERIDDAYASRRHEDVVAIMCDIMMEFADALDERFPQFPAPGSFDDPPTLAEGRVRKGGHNDPPAGPRPELQPCGQREPVNAAEALRECIEPKAKRQGGDFLVAGEDLRINEWVCIHNGRVWVASDSTYKAGCIGSTCKAYPKGHRVKVNVFGKE